MMITILVVIGLVVAYLTGNIWIAFLSLAAGIALLETVAAWLRSLIRGGDNG